MKYRPFISIILALFLFACSDKPEWQSSHPHAANERWVAHAGGLVRHMDHTNCLEGINASYKKGAHLIELDFDWTEDHQLVLTHDWHKTILKLYGQKAGKRTLAAFKAFKTRKTLTPVTAEELFAWLDVHPDVVIIADIKSHEAEAIKWIQKNYLSYAERIIPSITNFKNYEMARRLGFNRIVLDLWQTKYSDDEIFEFSKKYPVWAVAMTGEHVLKGSLTKDLNSINIPVYAFTINDSEQVKQLRAAGVYGIYSDSLSEKKD